MLKLQKVVRRYRVGSGTVEALRGVSISFRKHEFVAILGPSGCGKTTLLNLIGGLDRCDGGQIFVNGRSTEHFRDADWDAYRNHSVGFVFQSYNLIPHQSVRGNVELALTLSGVSRKERRERAQNALEQVGLGDQGDKKPNQLSGGQMQRVAIARALVNNPEIVLADEPTGALDSETSVQIMDLLKKVSEDRLVIMVTHNPELAARYATRTVCLSDGQVVSDSAPYESEEDPSIKTGSKNHTSMSFLTALSLSLRNLLTKKGRTLLTALAGSIGIIGIALILSMSSGIRAYINDTQEKALTNYPLSILEEETDFSELLGTIMGSKKESGNNGEDQVYVSSVMYDLVNAYNEPTSQKNNLKKFREYLENNPEAIRKYASMIRYSYDVPMDFYVRDTGDRYVKSDLSEVFGSLTGGMASGMAGMMSYEMWTELLAGENGEAIDPSVQQQYTLLAGEWPTKKEEVVLFLDANNEISDFTLYALGLMTAEEMTANLLAAQSGKKVELARNTYEFEEILGREFRLVLRADLYTDRNADGVYEKTEKDTEEFQLLVGAGIPIRISAVVKPNADAESSMTSRAVLGYTGMLVQHVMQETASRPAVLAQLCEENKNFDIFTGLPFVATEQGEPNDAEKAEALRLYFRSLPDAEKGRVYQSLLSEPNEEEIKRTLEQYLKEFSTRQQWEDAVVSSYAGMSVSEETIRNYLKEYSDEELRRYVTDAMRKMLIEKQKTEAEKTIEQIASTASEAELSVLAARFEAQFTDRQMRLMYVYTQYRERVSLPDSTIFTYLSSLSDAELNERLHELALSYAQEHYAEFAGASSAGGAAKVAKSFDTYVGTLSDEKLASLYASYMPSSVSSSTMDENLRILGVADSEHPSAIHIYMATFEDKQIVTDAIAAYNANAEEEDRISYTDYIGLILRSVTTIIDAVSYGLIAFVAVSLVVSSLMIGIITHISVLERTKEIGVLRAIGASRRDVSRVFDAETLIVGFAAGVLGVGVSALLIFPINAILRALTGLSSLKAYLPWQAALLLVLISMVLTLIAGLVPASSAAKKDPVVALRSE